jgi:hypothetical protein
MVCLADERCRAGRELIFIKVDTTLGRLLGDDLPSSRPLNVLIFGGLTMSAPGEARSAGTVARAS